MRPRVLLVHANPAVSASPVPPYGLERVARAFELAGCAVELCCPFVEEDPVAVLAMALAPTPDLVGFGVRNLDDALVVCGTEGPSALDLTFYLDALRPLVAAAVAAVGRERVLVGGAALSAGARAILSALGLRWGVQGPADDLCWRMGRALVRYEAPFALEDTRLVDVETPAGAPVRLAHAWRQPPGPTPRHGGWLSIALARGGRVPVQVATGCDRGCWHCVEPCATGRVVALRPVAEVVAEVEALARVGVRRLWLACSELNVPDARHAADLLRGLSGQGLDLRFYLQPDPVDDALLDALEGAGVDPAGLSFEFGHLAPEVLAAGGGPAPRAAIDRLVETWLRRGYRGLGATVLFGAHPAETEATLGAALAAARAIDAALPDGLGLALACGARVYPGTPLATRLSPDAPLYTADGGRPDPTFVAPVVHCRLGPPRALLRQIEAALAGMKGTVGPMNATAPGDLVAEALVTRGLMRLHEERFAAAVACFEVALRRMPAHREALAQLAQVRANRLGDRAGAQEALGRLLAALPAGDPGRPEVEAALEALGQQRQQVSGTNN
jgi:hypothetical protein